MTSSSTSPTNTIPFNDSQSLVVLNTQSSIKLKGTNQLGELTQRLSSLGMISSDSLKARPRATHPIIKTHYWTRQDQLILHASMDCDNHAFGNVKTTKRAWNILKKMFASKTRVCIMYLKEHLSCYTNRIKIDLLTLNFSILWFFFSLNNFFIFFTQCTYVITVIFINNIFLYIVHYRSYAHVHTSFYLTKYFFKIHIYA